MSMEYPGQWVWVWDVVLWEGKMSAEGTDLGSLES